MSTSREDTRHPTPSEARELPAGLVPVPVGKGCIVLLSEGEYIRAIKSGKGWKRREALRRRIGKDR